MWAVITGANGGIGQALCRAFKNEGYQVLATDQHEKCQHSDLNSYLSIDLIKFHKNETYRIEQISKILELTQQDSLKTLVNNAAIQVLGGANDIKTEDWEQTLAVNLLAPFWLIQGLFDRLDQSNGSVINISSVHEKLTKPQFICYATSKAALGGLTRSLAVDAGSRVRVNAIAPAAIRTPMLEAGFAGKPEKLQELERFHPSESIGQPHDVAKMALFLASDSAQFINGSVFGIDGGITARLHDPD